MVRNSEINSIRTSLVSSDKVMALLENPKVKNPNLKLLTRAFIEQPMLDDKMADAVNALKGTDGKLTLSEGISKLSYSMPNYKPSQPMTQYDYQEGRVSLASTLLHALIRGGLVEHKTKPVRSDTGKYKTTTTLFMEEDEGKMLMHGIHEKPGVVMQTNLRAKDGGKSLRLTSDQKNFLAEKSSKRLRLVKTPASELREYFHQTEWYIKAREGDLENNTCLKDRVESYIDAILELQKRDVIFLSVWFDTRYRLYYDMILQGINPHGKTFETSQWELADARLTDTQGHNHIIHSMVMIVDGRCSMKHALKVFNPKTYVLELLTGDYSISDAFYNKRLVQAYNDSVSQTPSRFLLAKDATTGGLQHHGIGFKSTKSMISSNVGGNKTPQDAHQDFADAFGLSVRQDAKDLNTPLLHGSSIATIVEILNAKHGTEHTEEYVIKHMIEAYGPEVMNISRIADFGTTLVSNQVSTLMFNTLDGWKAQSTAYIQSAELNVYYLNPEAKSGYGTNRVQRNMPLHVMKDGSFFTGTGSGTKRTIAKVKGLDANMTHVDDAYCLRGVNADMYKHDNFLMHANDMTQAESDYKQRLLNNWDASTYTCKLRDIGVQLGKEALVESFIETLVIGDATREMVETSEHFLSA